MFDVLVALVAGLLVLLVVRALRWFSVALLLIAWTPLQLPNPTRSSGWLIRYLISAGAGAETRRRIDRAHQVAHTRRLLRIARLLLQLKWLHQSKIEGELRIYIKKVAAIAGGDDLELTFVPQLNPILGKPDDGRRRR